MNRRGLSNSIGESTDQITQTPLICVMLHKSIPPLLGAGLNDPVKALFGVGPIHLARDPRRHIGLECERARVNVSRLYELAGGAFPIGGEQPDA